MSRKFLYIYVSISRVFSLNSFYFIVYLFCAKKQGHLCEKKSNGFNFQRLEVNVIAHLPGHLPYHGFPKGTEIEKKMPGYDTHIFWLGIPQGSQKCSNENIPCVSWRENAVFLILVVKITPNLVEKAVFLALYCWFLKDFDAIIQNQMAYITFSKSVDDFRQKRFENRSKDSQFAAFWNWISPFY